MSEYLISEEEIQAVNDQVLKKYGSYVLYDLYTILEVMKAMGYKVIKK